MVKLVLTLVLIILQAVVDIHGEGCTCTGSRSGVNVENDQTPIQYVVKYRTLQSPLSKTVQEHASAHNGQVHQVFHEANSAIFSLTPSSAEELHSLETVLSIERYVEETEDDAGTTSAKATKENGYDCGRVWIPPGVFKMGAEDKWIYPEDEEAPIRTTEIPPPGFWIDKCEVTNGQFRKFVKERKYLTDAEVYGWSFVFEQLLSKQWKKIHLESVQSAPWWKAVPRSWWRQPEGNDSSVKGKWDHPATHISWTDAYYFCKWKGGRLPTEAEWEYAARGGLEQRLFPWGDELEPHGEHMMNVWQGYQKVQPGRSHEMHNTKADGYVATSPVATFPPNAYGVHDMTGNVWEWTNSEFTGMRQQLMEREKPRLPNQSPTTTYRVKKGGSYMCHADYCRRYRNSARQGLESDSSAGNVGFRCAYDNGLDW
eukprot:TRINITY_DN12286_c0_g1_i1.p1 TRINITY_DN12286_c0_g1~~TRINITY_DN12286_c0_g1_i1.p1  ORF type:complete len:427 (-),score=46.51 TRINITY_DN12286_c0_g1_i1:485-1765(-)